MKKILSIICLAVLPFVAGYLFIKLKSSHLASQPLPPIKSGAIVNSSENENKSLIQTGKLIDILPLNTKVFGLDYSVKEGKFVVKIRKPHETGINSFKTWLKNKGFDLIPEDKFIYIREF